MGISKWFYKVFYEAIHYLKLSLNPKKTIFEALHNYKRYFLGYLLKGIVSRREREHNCWPCTQCQWRIINSSPFYNVCLPFPRKGDGSFLWQWIMVTFRYCFPPKHWLRILGAVSYSRVGFGSHSNVEEYCLHDSVCPDSWNFAQ